MRVPPELKCLPHGEPLAPEDGEERVEGSVALVCPQGCRVPVVDGIPRFVPSSDYASAFGRQWNAFRATQLDSYTGTTVSRDRLARCLGGSMDVVRGKSVLEVGCGAGRFTEVLLGAGARVFACDLSEAVEANYANNGNHEDYFVCQADVRKLPVELRSFDVVVCLGVIQHTPDPEETIAALVQQVRPGGILVIDHYSHGYPYTPSRRLLRPLLLKMPPAVSERSVLGLAKALLPLHRLSRDAAQSELFSRLKIRGAGRLKSAFVKLRQALVKHSPLVDYYDAYPQLGDKLMGEWSILDTHDTLTDYYKHFRSIEEIERALAACGLEEIEASSGGNGVEARARRPVVDRAVGGSS